MNNKLKIIFIVVLSVLIVAGIGSGVWFLTTVDFTEEKEAAKVVVEEREVAEAVETWQDAYIYWAQEKNSDEDTIFPAMRMTSDGNEQEQVFSSEDILKSSDGIIISTDGKKITTNCSTSEADYCVLDTEGKRVGDAAEEDINKLKNISDINLSNGRIIYVSEDHIWSRDSEGDDIQQLTFDGVNESPSISSDEQKIVFSTKIEDGGTSEIYTMNVDGSQQTRLTNNNVNDYNPRWSEHKISGLGLDFSNAREVLENFLDAKVSGNTQPLGDLVSEDLIRSQVDAIEKFEPAVSSYEVVAERELGEEDVEYDVKLNYEDNTVNSKTYTYKVHKTDEKWKVASQAELNNDQEEEISVSEVKTGSIDSSRADIETLQSKVDNGEEVWRLDPTQVAMIDGEQYGFSKSNDEFTQVSIVERGEYSGTGEATIDVRHGENVYIVQLMQPITQGDKGIWTLNSIVKK